MSEKIFKLACDEDKSDRKAQCHLMPCRIEYNDSTIKAKEYFWPTIRFLKAGGDEEQGREKSLPEIKDDPDSPTLTSSFRGRPLQGRKIVLPEGYKGHIVPKSSKSNVEATKNFDEFTYWNWDQLPNNDDAVVKALQWINISKAIHGSVEG